MNRKPGLFYAVQKYKYLIWLILAISICTVLPFAVASIVSYRNARIELYEQERQAEVRSLNQATESLNSQWKQITSFVTNLALDPLFREFSTYPRAAYYDSLRGELMSEEQPSLYEYFELKRKIYERLLLMMGSNDFIKSIYYYNESKDYIIYTEGYQRSLNNFNDVGWLEEAIVMPRSSFAWQVRAVSPLRGYDENTLTILYRTGRYGIFVVNLSADMLYQSFLHTFGRDDGSIMLVLSETGSPVLWDKNAPSSLFYSLSPSGLSPSGRPPDQPTDAIEHENLLDMIMSCVDSSESFVYTQADGEDLIVNVRRDGYLGWRIVSIRPESSYYAAADSLASFTFRSIVILAAFFILFASLVIMLVYRPVRNLARFAGQKHGGDLYGGEFRGIYQAITSAYENSAFLQKRLEDNMSVFRENFVFDLLKGKYTTQEDINSRMEEFGLDLDFSSSFVVAFAFRSEGEQPYSQARYKISLLLYDVVCETLYEKYRCVVEKMGEMQLIAVISCPVKRQQALFTDLDDTLGKISSSFGVSGKIAVSLVSTSVFDLPKSFDQAKETLWFDEDSYGRVDYYKDYIGDSGFIPGMPTTLVNQYRNSIRQGKAGESVSLLRDIISRFASRKSLGDLVYQRALYNRLLGECIDAAGSAGLDMLLAFGNSDPYIQLSETRSADEISAFLIQQTENLCRLINDTLTDKQNDYVTKTMQIIENDCGYDISLNYVAEKLETSASYLSRIIKQNTGSNFTEVLTRRRIEYSKELLRDTSQTVKAIAGEVGYTNSYYFIRLFKDSAGMTPGEYRKSVQQ